MMNILFISYRAVSLSGGQVRSFAMLKALADAGYRVDLLAPESDLPEHPNIRLLLDKEKHRPRRGQLRMAGLRAAGRTAYAAIHAVDEAVFFAHRLSRLKKVPLVYDAVRRFSGSSGSGIPHRYRLFPSRFQRMEAAVLNRAGCVFSPCSALTADLSGLDRHASIVQLEDIPMQPLCGIRETDKHTLLEQFGKRPASVVVCCALPDGTAGIRDMLVAARKVVEVSPDVAFFLNGIQSEQAKKMAANLDIAEHCAFIPADDPKTFLSVLDIADAILLVPQGEGRYIHPLVFTLLNAPAPLVAVHSIAYDDLLNESTAVHVLPGSEAISEGILRTIQEPLFSMAVATEGQRLVATNHSYSSFKHKVRMAYYKLLKQE